MAIDVWSFGCIMAELYTGKKIYNILYILITKYYLLGQPIFPGDNEQE